MTRASEPDAGTAAVIRSESEAGREGQVLGAVVSIVDSLLNDFDIIEVLTQLSERCVELLDVASAGLLLTDASHHQLHLMAATSDKTRALELFQLQSDEGPCLDCYATGEPVSVADLREHTARWPRFVQSATEAGFASVHALPMRAAGLVLGALGLFGTTAGALNDADLVVAKTLAHIATVAIVQEHPPTPVGVLPHLRSALVARVVVEQAKGFLRSRLNVSVDEAFTLMRRYAQLRGEPLSQIARTIVSDAAARPATIEGISRLTTRHHV